MSREWRLFFNDLVDFCERILAYTEGMTMESFVASQINYDATVRNVELLGEAAKGVPEEIRCQMPEVPWRDIIGIRNVLAHGYFGINQELLWDIIQNEVPSLLNHLKNFAQRIERGEIH